MMRNINTRKMTKTTPWKIAVAVSCAALSTLAASPTSADVLEQKWQAGQQLSYDFKLDGTMRLTTPADTIIRGFPIGGLPLEMLLKGDGQSTLDAREVDEFGTALVVPKLEHMQLKFNETTFNQNGAIGLRDGFVNVSMNGQNVGAANMDARSLLNPNFGLRFTKSLRVTGIQPLKNAGDKTAANDKAPAAPGGATMGLPAMIQGMIVRAIPPLLPTHDVSIGDSWDANVEWPAMPGTASNAAPRDPIGKFNFKAVAEEEVQGRKTWRIATDGVLEATDVATKTAGEKVEKESEARGQTFPFKIPSLMSMKQKVKGDIWFDPAAGQIVKADLRLESAAESRVAAGKAADGSMNFNGRLQMDLRKTSFSSAQ